MAQLDLQFVRVALVCPGQAASQTEDLAFVQMGRPNFLHSHVCFFCRASAHPSVPFDILADSIWNRA